MIFNFNSTVLNGFFRIFEILAENGQFWPHFEISIWMNEALFN